MQPKGVLIGRRRVTLAAALLVLMPALGAAQPADQKPPTAAEQKQQPTAPPEQKPAEEQQPPRINIEVVVTAPRMDIPLKENPAATTVVVPEVLRTMPRSLGAEEALQLVPGVKVDNQADGERVHLSIRGQGLLTERGIRGIKVLLDGLPLNDPSGFAPDLFDVDWRAVNRIEVLRGPASALYGGGSSGGVINITTRDGGAGGPSGLVAVDGGSYSFFKGFGEIGGTSGKVNYRVSASGNTGDGYRLHTDFYATNLYGKFRIKASDRTTLTAIGAGTLFYNGNAEGLNLAWLSEDLGQGISPPRRQANPDALTYNEYQRTRRITAGVSGQTVLAPNQDLSYAVYYRNTGWRESVPSSVQHRTYNTPGFMVRYNLHHDIGPLKNHLTVGSDFDWQVIDEYRHPNLGNAEEGPELLTKQQIDQRGIGLYVLDRVDLNPQWGLTGGLRTDRIHNQLQDELKLNGVDLSGSADFAKTTGRLGVAFNPRPDIGFYASWGQGFMPPATEELANNPDQQGGFNTHLVPATSQGEEVGVRGAHKGLSYDITFFHLDTENDFGRYRVPDRPLETFYGNLGHSRRYGLETAFGYYPTPGLALQVAYTFNDFLYTQVSSLFGDFTNVVMPNSPRHQLAADAEYTFREHWVVGVNVFAQSMWYVDQSNVPTADGYWLLSPRLAYRWTGGNYRGEVMFTARNVTGTEYMAFTEPDPDGNSYQPGPTEEFFVGVRFWLGGK
jgi:iron complex outermembrane receptor protein